MRAVAGAPLDAGDFSRDPDGRDRDEHGQDGEALLANCGWRTRTIDITFPPRSGRKGLVEALDRICREASTALPERYGIWGGLTEAERGWSRR